MYTINNKAILYGFKCRNKNCYMGGYSSIDGRCEHKKNCKKFSKLTKRQRLFHKKE